MCDPETRKNCATLKESLMDIDSNFDDDYKSINALKIKKREIEIKSKKKVTFDCADENSPCKKTFDYEHEDINVSDEESFNEDQEDENISDEEDLDEYEDEDVSHDEHYGNDHEEEFDYDHEEENDSSDEDYSDNELNKNLLNNNCNMDNKINNMKEDIYGRIRKPDGTIMVKYLFINNCLVKLFNVLIIGTINRLCTSTFKTNKK